MTRFALVLAVVVTACNPRHDVRVLFGPNEDQLTVGFRCVSDTTGQPLFQRAALTQHFALVIDFLTVKRGTPGCRGEDVAESCFRNPGNCELVLPIRYCVDVAVDDIDVDPNDPNATLKSLGAYLRETAPIITPDAPDRVTVLRAVTTTEFCATLDGTIDVDQAIGCAYSCPTRLDSVDDSISLSLDSFDEHCETQMRLCAGFLNP